jgi:hypothetical protein
MVGVSGVTVSITCFISAETIEGMFAAFRERAVITVTRIVAIIYVAIETVMTVEPGSCSDEDAVQEPIGAVVAVGCTIVWRIVEIAIGTVGLGTEVDADANTDLGRHGGAAGANEAQQTEYYKRLDQTHTSPP